WWLTAPGVTKSSFAAFLKLRCRAAASKARSAFRGGSRSFVFAMAQFFSCVAGIQIGCCTATSTLYFVHGTGYKPKRWVSGMPRKGDPLDIRKDFPEYTAIEGHIRRAHAERSLYLA